MKLITVKKRFFNYYVKHSSCPKLGEERGKNFWRESIKNIKFMFWKDGKFNQTPKYMIYFCLTTNGVVGVER